MTTQPLDLAELMADLATLEERTVSIRVNPQGHFGLACFSDYGPGSKESGPYTIDELLAALQAERTRVAGQVARRIAAMERGLA